MPQTIARAYKYRFYPTMEQAQQLANRSESDRKARDTFLSLKKTCQKLEVSFLGYLKDRVHRLNEIPLLATTLRQQAQLARAKCS